MHVDQGFRGRVFDLDTGKEVRYIISIDCQSTAPRVVSGQSVIDIVGTVEAYQVGPDGKEAGEQRADGWHWLTYRATGRFCYVPRKSTAKEIVMGAPTCARCGSKLTLRGDELCPPCRARERGQRCKMIAERIDDPLALHKCEQCSLQATWSVSDEVEATPELARVDTVVLNGRRMLVPNGQQATGKKMLWDQAAVVDRHHYCDKHYQPPQLVDSKGEVISAIDTANRPQW